MREPKLTEKIERELNRQIEANEVLAREKSQPVPVKPYLQLADLYRFQKQPDLEIAVLNRVLESGLAAASDQEAIALRVQQVKNLRAAARDLADVEIASEPEADNTIDIEKLGNELSLIEEKPEPKPSKKLPEVKMIKRPGVAGFAESQFRFATICVAFTGDKEDDELVEVSLILAEKPRGERDKVKLLKKLTMARKTLKPVPAKTTNQFGLNIEHEVLPWNVELLRQHLDLADFVVSHNDAEIERQHLTLFIPELANKAWHSMQKGVPWKALGFKFPRLSSITQHFEIRRKKGTLGRAKAIYDVLLQQEPHSEHTILERIYYLPPIKPMQWTDALRKQQKRLNRKPVAGWLKWLAASLVVLAIAAAGLWYALMS